MKVRGDKKKNRTPFRQILVVMAAILISVYSGVGAYHYLKKDVIIEYDSNKIKVSTMKSTVGEVLDQHGIIIGPDDYINIHPGENLMNYPVNRINIKKAVSVRVLVDGKELEFMTYEETVKDLLDANNIKLDENDKLSKINLQDKIKENMTIKVIRVDHKIVDELEPISYDIVKKPNKYIDEGIEKIIKEGKKGVREKRYKVIYENGVEVSRNLVNDTVLENPENKLIEYGTIIRYNTARGGVIRYKKAIYNMKATAYTSSYEDTGKHPSHPDFGITFTGIKARNGIIAVDPDVIPLGSRVYVEIRSKYPDYGFALAADTGGAIKGNIIDVYLDTQQQVYDWGIKRVNVYILAD